MEKKKKKKKRAQIWAKWARIGSKISFFFVIFSSLVYYFVLEIGCNDILEDFLTTSRGKTHEKNFGVQLGSEIRVSAIFSRLHH